MRKLWPTAKTSTILKYILVITAISVVCNMVYQRGLFNHDELDVGKISETDIHTINSIEVTDDTILYQLPATRFGPVLAHIGDLTPVPDQPQTEDGELGCQVHISLKNEQKIILVVSRQSSSSPWVLAIQSQHEDRTGLMRTVYSAQDFCPKIINP